MTYFIFHTLYKSLVYKNRLSITEMDFFQWSRQTRDSLLTHNHIQARLLVTGHCLIKMANRQPQTRTLATLVVR